MLINRKTTPNIDGNAWAKKELSNTTFGQLVRSLRECDSVSQTVLASKIGVSKQFLSDIERDRRPATIAFAKKIAKAMGYAVEPLIEIIIRDELHKNQLDYDIELKIKHSAA